MHKPNSNPQTGFALLIFVVMLMGVGGIALVGYSESILKQVEDRRYQQNRRVLNEAKQALLLYAHNYPIVTPGRGPGRLPCPYDLINGYTGGVLSNAICQAVGRLPWQNADLNFFDARDVAGEQLWYAVSSNFHNFDPGGGSVINSATPGTITLIDQSGATLYNGAISGIAAVIIAPGPAIRRDNDANGTYETLQVRTTVAQQQNPANYLDTVGGFDNSVFLNIPVAPADGFILGPVYSPNNNSIVVNDQMVVITADELHEVAEKAVLQAYRNSINDYLALTGNVYPWLYNYTGVPDVAGLNSYFPVDPAGFATELATNLDNFGRIPSIFDDYFTEANSVTIETELGGSISWGGPATVNGYLFLDGPPAIDLPVPNKIADVSFVDIPDVVGNDGQLTATFLTPEALTYEIYYWEYDHNPLTGGWTLCWPPADKILDCSQDASRNPIPGSANLVDLDIIRLVVTLDFNGVVNFNLDYANAPGISYGPATGAAHASTTGTYAGVDIISLPFLSATYERDEHYHDDVGEIAFDPVDGPYEAGPLNMVDFGRGPLSLTMRYFPELPDWAFDNVWHDSVMMAYANDFRPDLGGAAGNCDLNPPCIQIIGLAGTNNDKISILTIAGQRNWDDDADLDFINDLPTIFDAENADILDVDGTEYLFDKHAVNGNDKIAIVN